MDFIPKRNLSKNSILTKSSGWQQGFQSHRLHKMDIHLAV